MASLKVIHDPPLKNCVNCLDEFGHCQRPAPYGLKTKPLCRTHALAKRNATRRKNHRSYVEQTYGLGAGEYDALYEYQGGKCAICRRATGKTKNLSVDHNHRHCDQCAGKNSCGQGVRGLLCLRCNTLLGHLRDDLDAAQRIYEYLSKPPYPTMMADREYLDQLEPEHPYSAWQSSTNPERVGSILNDGSLIVTEADENPDLELHVREVWAILMGPNPYLPAEVYSDPEDDAA